MDLTPDQIQAFVGPRADYYLSRWDRLREQHSRALGFNWGAFFLSFSWLLYRRMYRTFWVALVLFLPLTCLLEILTGEVGRTDLPPILKDMLRLVVHLVDLAVYLAFGIFGTYWYYLHARRKLRALTARGDATAEELSLAGGVNWFFPLLFVALAVLCYVLSWAFGDQAPQS